jgi:hypothetical protein
MIVSAGKLYGVVNAPKILSKAKPINTRNGRRLSFAKLTYVRELFGNSKISIKRYGVHRASKQKV